MKGDIRNRLVDRVTPFTPGGAKTDPERSSSGAVDPVWNPQRARRFHEAPNRRITPRSREIVEEHRAISVRRVAERERRMRETRVSNLWKAMVDRGRAKQQRVLRPFDTTLAGV